MVADRVLLLGVTLAVAVPGCTVFNGKTLPANAGAPAADGGGAVATGAACTCPASANVCDTFETGPGENWSSLGDVPPTSDAAHVHCGAAALHLHTPAIAPGESVQSGLVDTRILATLTQGFYARAWVYVPEESTLVPGNPVSLLEVQQDRGDFLGMSTQMKSSTLAIADWAAMPNEYEEAGSPIARARWTCLEWQTTLDPTNGASQLWVDGSATPAAFTGKTTTASPPFSRFLAAVYFTSVESAQPAFDMWIDDLAIGPSRIGCGD